MPGGDGTGPMGLGPMTGRGAGFCVSYETPGFTNIIPGRGNAGFGRGRGRGMGCGMGIGWRHGRRYQSTPLATQPVSYQPASELLSLKNQAKSLGEALQAINNRISELETETK